MKIIIAGDGKVGATLTRQLSLEGNDLTLIDSNPRVLDSSIEQYDILTVTGNCATMDVLRRANVEEAELLIAATSADEINLLCCMTAHAINPALHTIARIRNPEYTEQIYQMRDVFALSLIVNPERQAAVEMERLLSFPGFLRRDSFARGRLEIVELRVDAASKLKELARGVDVALHELNTIIKCKVLICTVLRSGTVIMPRGDFILREGDRIFVTAPTEALATLLKNLGIITHRVNRVILAGGGRISYYMVQQLEKRGIQTTIIEKDPQRCVELAELLPRVTVIHGDASDPQVLESEGLRETNALVSLTGIDEMNLLISLYATNLGVPQVITKLGHLDNSNILDNLAIGSVVSPKELCCANIVRFARALQNQTGAAVSVHSIANGQAEAVEFRVDEQTPRCGEPLKAIRLRKNVLLAGISHGGRTEIPNGDSVFHIGDTLIIVVTADTVIHQLNEIFE